MGSKNSPEFPRRNEAWICPVRVFCESFALVDSCDFRDRQGKQHGCIAGEDRWEKLQDGAEHTLSPKPRKDATCSWHLFSVDVNPNRSRL